MTTSKYTRTPIHIPAPLRSYTDGQTIIKVQGNSVGDALDDLTRQFPVLKQHLFDEEGALRSFVNIYLNDEDIRYLGHISTLLSEDDELSIVPSIAGGCPETLSTADIRLSPEELRRYQRHLILPEVGVEGQTKLKAASVLIVGVGGLGSPLGLYLAAAGVGRIGLVDFDIVEESNLQRQVLHGVNDVGRSKLASARDRIRDVNEFLTIDLHETRLTSENAIDIISDYDLVADGTDNFPTRFLVNDACVLTGTPNVYASIFRFDGQVSVFGMPNGPCYRCLYPEPPPPGLVPSCAEGGVLGVLPGLVGTLQANEVIKLILGIGEPLIGRLLLIDALTTKFRTLIVRKDDDCPVCGTHPTVKALIDYEEFCGIGADSGLTSEVQSVPEITVFELDELRKKHRAPFVLDVRKPFEAEIADLGADQLIPVEELSDRLGEIRAKPDSEIVVHCRSGARSAQAVSILLENGFDKAINLKGGIRAWREEIDSTVLEY
ncbi:MAG: molybdopterin-synthase adenylyltransferase MoeB [Bacteroidetes bacterium]|nr:MAG: molybdopterin-synthase adenylyltransferase MoeB [Bacteroidota bacterium]